VLLQPKQAMAAASADRIFHFCTGAESKPTILLHSLFSTHVEFTKVTPYLQEGYSLLLVDLPEHSVSNDIPFFIPTAADQLQQLIHDQVPNHRVHVVGVSLGGCFGLGLARQHPHRMKSLFATGSVPYRGVGRFIAEHPQLLYCIIVIQSSHTHPTGLD
jgi:pimeloyl-ACP methyl ester carboxylesterase